MISLVDTLFQLFISIWIVANNIKNPDQLKLIL